MLTRHVVTVSQSQTLLEQQHSQEPAPLEQPVAAASVSSGDGQEGALTFVRVETHPGPRIPTPTAAAATAFYPRGVWYVLLVTFSVSQSHLVSRRCVQLPLVPVARSQAACAVTAAS